MDVLGRITVTRVGKLWSTFTYLRFSGSVLLLYYSSISKDKQTNIQTNKQAKKEKHNQSTNQQTRQPNVPIAQSILRLLRSPLHTEVQTISPYLV